MAIEPSAPVCGGRLDALRGVATSRGELRPDAYPSALPVLRELGYVEEWPTRGRASQYV